MLGYGTLGAVAGGAAGLVTLASGLRWGLAALLVLAAVLMLAQASKRLGGWVPRLGWPTPRLPRAVERRIGALLADPTGWRGVLLGVLLSALPCGLLYAALAAAAAGGSALAGGLGDDGLRARHGAGADGRGPARAVLRALAGALDAAGGRGAVRPQRGGAAGHGGAAGGLIRGWDASHRWRRRLGICRIFTVSSHILGSSQG